MIMSFALTYIHIFMLGYIVTGFSAFDKYIFAGMNRWQKVCRQKRIRHILIRNMPEKEDRI